MLLAARDSLIFPTFLSFHVDIDFVLLHFSLLVSTFSSNTFLGSLFDKTCPHDLYTLTRRISAVLFFCSAEAGGRWVEWSEAPFLRA